MQIFQLIKIKIIILGDLGKFVEGILGDFNDLVFFIIIFFIICFFNFRLSTLLKKNIKRTFIKKCLRKKQLKTNYL